MAKQLKKVSKDEEWECKRCSLIQSKKHKECLICSKNNRKSKHTSIKGKKDEHGEFHMKSSWLCPICKGLMKRPVTIKGEPKNHVFCYQCINMWIKKFKPTNPLTNKKLKNKPEFKREYKIEKEIEKFVSKIERNKSQMANDIFDQEMKHLRPYLVKYKALAKWASNIMNKVSCGVLSSPKDCDDDNNNINNINDDSKQSHMGNFDDLIQGIGDQGKQYIDRATERTRERAANAPAHEIPIIISEFEEEVGLLKKTVQKLQNGIKMMVDKLFEFISNLRYEISGAASELVWTIAPKVYKAFIKTLTEVGAITGGVVGILGGGFLGCAISLVVGAGTGTSIFATGAGAVIGGLGFGALGATFGLGVGVVGATLTVSAIAVAMFGEAVINAFRDLF